MGSCKIKDEAGETKDVVLVNSGESVLIFDLSVTLSTGMSGLIKMLHLSDIIGCLASASAN